MEKVVHLTSTIYLILLLTLTGCSEVEFEDIIVSSSATAVPAGPSPVVPTPISPISFSTESFIQGATTKPIDILFVVDNSPSMKDEQEKMGLRIQSFLSKIQNVDWKIAITTTDVSNGSHGLKGEMLTFSGDTQKHIDKASPNFQNKFLQTIQRDESDCIFFNCPSSDEQPLMATILAMQKQSAENSHFFRPEADLAVVMMSDEDEMSTGPIEATTADEVISTFNSIWGGLKKMRVYGLVIEPNDVDCLNDNEEGFYGYAISDLVQQTGGIQGSICSGDYGQSLSEIGDSVLELVQNVSLKHEPLPGSVSITFSPDQPLAQWNVVGKSIHFTNPPQVATKITVSYLPKR